MKGLKFGLSSRAISSEVSIYYLVSLESKRFGWLLSRRCLKSRVIQWKATKGSQLGGSFRLLSRGPLQSNAVSSQERASSRSFLGSQAFQPRSPSDRVFLGRGALESRPLKLRVVHDALSRGIARADRVEVFEVERIAKAPLAFFRSMLENR